MTTFVATTTSTRIIEDGDIFMDVHDVCWMAFKTTTGVDRAVLLHWEGTTPRHISDKEPGESREINLIPGPFSFVTSLSEARNVHG